MVRCHVLDMNERGQQDPWLKTVSLFAAIGSCKPAQHEVEAQTVPGATSGGKTQTVITSLSFANIGRLYRPPLYIPIFDLLIVVFSVSDPEVRGASSLRAPPSTKSRRRLQLGAQTGHPPTNATDTNNLSVAKPPCIARASAFPRSSLSPTTVPTAGLAIY
jgi:hypothetical protein